MADPWDDPRARRWAADVERNMVPKMRDSTAVAPVYTGEIDAKLAVEVGAAVLLDKPIILIVAPGVKVPNKLIAIADRIVEGDLADEDGHAGLSERLRTAMDEVADG